MLMILQNRGRTTSARLAEELEVSRRTVLRDLDAMTEAGLPVIVHRGHGGGIELGFGYRSQLTMLTSDEAEALALMLDAPAPALETLGLGQAARRAAGKVAEAQSAPVRAQMAAARSRVTLQSGPVPEGNDPRPAALAGAIAHRNRVLLQTRSSRPRAVEPIHLTCDPRGGWLLTCATAPDSPIPIGEWGHIAISSRRF